MYRINKFKRVLLLCACLHTPALLAGTYAGDIYNTQQSFIVRNTRAQSVQVFPFQYNPATRVLRVYYQLILTAEYSGIETISNEPEISRNAKSVEGLGVNCINQPASRLKAGQSRL